MPIVQLNFERPIFIEGYLRSLMPGYCVRSTAKQAGRGFCSVKKKAHPTGGDYFCACTTPTGANQGRVIACHDVKLTHLFSPTQGHYARQEVGKEKDLIIPHEYKPKRTVNFRTSWWIIFVTTSIEQFNWKVKPITTTDVAHRCLKYHCALLNRVARGPVWIRPNSEYSR